MGNPFTNESDAMYEAREAEERNADRRIDGLPEHTICPVEGCNVGVLPEHGVYCRTHRHLETKRTAPAETLPEIAPPSNARPIVRQGDVAAQLFNELRMLFHRVTTLESFERHVMEAAKSPAAWLALRQELSK